MHPVCARLIAFQYEFWKSEDQNVGAAGWCRTVLVVRVRTLESHRGEPGCLVYMVMARRGICGARTKGQGGCHRNQCQEVSNRGSVFSLLLLLPGVLLRKRGRGRQAFLMYSRHGQLGCSVQTD